MERSHILRDGNIFTIDSFYHKLDDKREDWYSRVELNGKFSEWKKVPSKLIDRGEIIEELIEELLKK